MPFEKDPNEIGALWVHDGNKGQWFSGSVTVGGTTTKIVIFATNAKGEKAPTHRILIAKKKEGETSMDQRPAHDANRTPLDDF
jgi:uncharacterized protein (DUF736 family)